MKPIEAAIMSRVEPRITTIRIRTTTRDLLKEFGVKGDSYDEIILRALAWQEQGQAQLQKQQKPSANERAALIQELIVIEEGRRARA